MKAALRPKPLFLDPEAAVDLCAAPAAAGLRDRLGAALCQISPLPPPWLASQGLLPRL